MVDNGFNSSISAPFMCCFLLLQYAVIVGIIILMMISGAVAGYLQRDDVSLLYNC